MILSHIVAFSENFAIGKNNQLLWHIAEDLKYFKQKTSGKILIMGRKTFDSLGKPLPKRFHIVVTRTPKTSENPNVIFVLNIAAAYAAAKELTSQNLWPDEVMICGGAEIYKQTLSDCDFLFFTRIPGTFEADTFYTSEFKNTFTRTLVTKSEAIDGLSYEVWSKNNIVSK